MDHQDVSHSLKSGGILSSAVTKMASVDFVIQDLQSLVSQQYATGVDEEERSSQRDLCSLLGMKVSFTDQEYIYRGCGMILRQGGISQHHDEKLHNIYDSKTEQVYSTAHLDRESLDVGRFLTEKCIAKEHLFECTSVNKPNVDSFKGPASLLQKASTTKSTTIKRTVTKLEKKKKSENDLLEEKRMRRVNREKKRVECVESKMNAARLLSYLMAQMLLYQKLIV